MQDTTRVREKIQEAAKGLPFVKDSPNWIEESVEFHMASGCTEAEALDELLRQILSIKIK